MNGVGLRNPDRPGIVLQPLRLLEALHDALDLVGLVVEAGAAVAGDERWRNAGQLIRRAARQLRGP